MAHRPERASRYASRGIGDADNDLRGLSAPTRRSVAPENLHICPSCASQLVYPVEWAPVDAAHWHVELRCPECEWTEAGLHEQAVVDRFDEDARLRDRLAGGGPARASSAPTWRMSWSGSGWRLEAGLILPEDF